MTSYSTSPQSTQPNVTQYYPWRPNENLEKQELLIERAQGQYLIDNNGEHYLDLINNVAHGKYLV